MSNPTPGYLITVLEQGAYLGGMMVTDDHGIPIDFRYTDPVIPTEVHRIIYGSVLDKYIRGHVIAGAIAKEVSNPPSFFIVPGDQLPAAEETSALTIIAVQRTQFASLGERGTVNRAKDNSCLLQGCLDTHPLKVTFGNMPTVRQEVILKDLTNLSRFMDLVEPLERLEKALKTLYATQQSKKAT